MVVLGCVEKIESEDGQRIGFERGAIFFSILGFMYYWVLEKKKKKNRIFVFFLKNNVDMENCGASKDFGYIYIYIYEKLLHILEMYDFTYFRNVRFK